MKTYLVGGAVRDGLLGRPVNDRDYVVVGATPDQLLELGYQQVGSSFPVFLHPETKEEYALARTERKTGVGYKGFEAFFGADVTLEEDLRRRDLTINAMAQDLETGEIIDPYGGRNDLRMGVLRHVSEAFAEDPLRVLRVARFTAKLTVIDSDGCSYCFSVAPETMELMGNIVADGEMKHLTKERVWKEIERGLEEENAAQMFIILRQCNAIHDISLFSKDLRESEREFRDILSSLVKSAFAKPLVKMILVADPNEVQGWKLPKAYNDGIRLYHETKDLVVMYHTISTQQKIELITKLIGDYGTDKHGVLEACVYISRHPLKVMTNVFQMLRDYEVLKKLDLGKVVSQAASDGANIKERVLAAKIAALD